MICLYFSSPTHGVVLTANTPFQEYPPSQAVQPQDANRLHQKQIWRPHNIHNSKVIILAALKGLVLTDLIYIF